MSKLTDEDRAWIAFARGKGCNRDTNPGTACEVALADALERLDADLALAVEAARKESQREIALAVACELDRDIPNTVVGSLRQRITRFLDTGVWPDDAAMLGFKSEVPWRWQRMLKHAAEEAVEAEREACVTLILNKTATPDVLYDRYALAAAIRARSSK